jgi:hypothetical protein
MICLFVILVPPAQERNPGTGVDKNTILNVATFCIAIVI